jgi:serine/threonine protein kinase
LLAADGTPKVSDFGAVYMTGSDETQVIGVGTLPFMPPEHFEGVKPDVQNDIYAVGVMAYNLLTGAWPNQGSDQAAMIYDKLHNDPVPLETRRPEVPAGLRAAIYRAMHKDRRVRYQSWKVFREVLSATFPEIRDDSTAAYESERFETLRTVPFFARFSETELWEAVRIGVRTYYEPKAEVIEEGSSDDTVYVVQTGELEVIHRGVRVGRIQAGEGFGEMSYIEGTERPRSASVRTLIPTYLISFPSNSLKKASADLQAAFARAIVSLLVRRLISSNDRYVAAVKTAKKAPEKQ